MSISSLLFFYFYQYYLSRDKGSFKCKYGYFHEMLIEGIFFIELKGAVMLKKIGVLKVLKEDEKKGK